MFKKLRKDKHLTISLFDLHVHLLILAKVYFFLLMSFCTFIRKNQIIILISYRDLSLRK